MGRPNTTKHFLGYQAALDTSLFMIFAELVGEPLSMLCTVFSWDDQNNPPFSGLPSCTRRLSIHDIHGVCRRASLYECCVTFFDHSVFYYIIQVVSLSSLPNPHSEREKSKPTRPPNPLLHFTVTSTSLHFTVTSTSRYYILI